MTLFYHSQMAVAAAIGVGSDDTTNTRGQIPPNNALAQRLSNKMKMMPNHPSSLGEINRSIEKMSIGSYATNNQHCTMPSSGLANNGSTMPVTTMPATNR